MKRVLISHFYNEEYLLPWWLNHHRNMFDHGILLDYGSTDRSVDYIRELAPTWEVFPSRNENFAAYECDQEVMDVERGLGECWKMVLNTTEFFFTSGIGDMLANVDAGAIHFEPAIMIDRPDLQGIEPNPQIPLALQRYFGVFQRDSPFQITGRSRIMHRHACGEYHVGRHATNLDVTFVDGHFTLWYAFSPMTQALIQRKLQIQNRIPRSDTMAGFGGHHITSRDEQLGIFNSWSQHTTDLRSDEDFGRIWDSLYFT